MPFFSCYYPVQQVITKQIALLDELHQLGQKYLCEGRFNKPGRYRYKKSQSKSGFNSLDQIIDYLSIYITSFTAFTVRATLGKIASIKVGA
jgi:hypothetical protein